MRKFLFKCSMFLARHRAIYYILNCTWGIILTFIGWVITLALLIVGKKPIPYHGVYYFPLKENWGGFEMGMMFIRDTTSTEHVSKHELGHTFQNAILGPFMIFLVSLPSVFRYWYRYLKFERKGLTPTTEYDNIWFEGSASEIGTKVVEMEQNRQKGEKQ